MWTVAWSPGHWAGQHGLHLLSYLASPILHAFILRQDLTQHKPNSGVCLVRDCLGLLTIPPGGAKCWGCRCMPPHPAIPLLFFLTRCHHVTQAGLYVDTTGFKLLFLQPLASRVLGSQASTTMPGPCLYLQMGKWSPRRSLRIEPQIQQRGVL